MAKTRDIVNQTVSELTAQLKEIKQGNEDDLGSLADQFDEIGWKAQGVAAQLGNADKALSGEEEGEEEELEEGEDEDAEGEE